MCIFQTNKGTSQGLVYFRLTLGFSMDVHFSHQEPHLTGICVFQTDTTGAVQCCVVLQAVGH